MIGWAINSDGTLNDASQMFRTYELDNEGAVVPPANPAALEPQPPVSILHSLNPIRSANLSISECSRQVTLAAPLTQMGLSRMLAKSPGSATLMMMNPCPPRQRPSALLL